MYTCIHTYIHTYIYTNIYIFTVSEIAGLTSYFASKNCLGCYSKLNLGSKFHAEVATHFPHTKSRILYPFNIFLE